MAKIPSPILEALGAGRTYHGENIHEMRVAHPDQPNKKSRGLVIMGREGPGSMGGHETGMRLVDLIDQTKQEFEKAGRPLDSNFSKKLFDRIGYDSEVSVTLHALRNGKYGNIVQERMNQVLPKNVLKAGGPNDFRLAIAEVLKEFPPETKSGYLTNAQMNSIMERLQAKGFEPKRTSVKTIISNINKANKPKNPILDSLGE